MPSGYVLRKNDFTLLNVIWYVILFFLLLLILQWRLKGKKMFLSLFLRISCEKALHLKLFHQAHQSRKVEVTCKNSRHMQLMYNSCINTADVLYKVIN